MKPMSFRFQYRLRTLLAAPVVVAVVCGLWSFHAKWELRRRLEKAICERSHADAASRDVLVRMLRASSDPAADPFPLLGIFFDRNKFDQYIPGDEKSLKKMVADDAFRFFPFGHARVVFRRDLRTADGSARCLVLFETPVIETGATLCLLDPSYRIVAWQSVGGYKKDLRMLATSPDPVVEIDYAPNGLCDVAVNAISSMPRVQFRVKSDCLERFDVVRPL